MGNSMRVMFGNMCGGEAAKEQQEHAEEQKPIEQPKVENQRPSKSKKKKSKDMITDIKDTNEPKNMERPLTEGAADVEEIIEHAQGSYSGELQDGGCTSDADSVNDKQRSLSAASASENKKIHKIYEVEPIRPESIGVADADQVFARSAELFEPFVKKNFDFRTAVLQFEHSVDPEKSQPDFEKCWEDYNEMLRRESESGLPAVIERDESVNDDDESAKPLPEPRPRRVLPAVDVCDVSANLQAIRATGRHLLRIIDSTRAQIESNIKEANSIDIKEHVKGKVVDGQQLGLLSKYTAPRKLRRNLRQLKRAQRQLDGVARETKSIMDVIEPLIEDENAEETFTLKSHTTEEESVIVPVERAPVVECEVDLFAQLGADLPAASEPAEVFDLKEGVVDADMSVEVKTCVTGDVTSVRDDVARVAGNVANVTDNVGIVTGYLSSVTDDAASVTGDVACVRGDVLSVTGDVASVTCDVASVTGDVACVRGDVLSVTGDVASVTCDVASVTGDVVHVNPLEIAPLSGELFLCDVTRPSATEKSKTEDAQEPSESMDVSAGNLPFARVVPEQLSDVGSVEGSADGLAPSVVNASEDTTEVIEITEVHEITYTEEADVDTNQSEPADAVRATPEKHMSEMVLQVGRQAATAAPEKKTLSPTPSLQSEPSFNRSRSPSPGPKMLLNLAPRRSVSGSSPEERGPPSPLAVAVVMVPTVVVKIPKNDVQSQKTFVIEQLPDVGKEGSKDQPAALPAALPDAIERVPPVRSSSCQDLQRDDHETMDYGKYVLVNPTTSDVQVLRERSNSLDSLASLQSALSVTSGLSRYGSFEFVTNHEVVIAEKNLSLNAIEST